MQAVTISSAVVVSSVLGACTQGNESAQVRISAAASVESPLRSLAARYSSVSGVRVTINAASTAVLARQIAAGAPVDVFVAANLQWMDWLESAGFIESDTRTSLVGNSLVLVAPRGKEFAVKMESTFDLGAVLDGCLAMGQVDAVPAGMYGKAALVELGWWPRLSGRVVEAADVRAALALVERGECAAGLVYSTDVGSTTRVEVVATVADELHPAIVYPAAIVSGRADAETMRFFDYLTGEAAAHVFVSHGFSVSPNE